jgi:hypothetical protein
MHMSAFFPLIFLLGLSNGQIHPLTSFSAIRLS